MALPTSERLAFVNQVEKLKSDGLTIDEACRKLKQPFSYYYKWKKELKNGQLPSVITYQTDGTKRPYNFKKKTTPNVVAFVGDSDSVVEMVKAFLK